ncbi:C3HC zinc finger-like-domain-containing protein [Lasiosphaeris hirsuta]|uniref:C3HC zinc finger-like-domain-containing protein n=1 Tax=Lasiosphaeris hirsuta TaxID=260670 RepID=A0AA40A2Q8_9PEZI|nr:C3HC zinc finger-like-domain-containing protein [Lasiosphaeris hirsuta]
MNATVKRKFNALLQGIGNRPPSASVSASDPNHPSTSTLSDDHHSLELSPTAASLSSSPSSTRMGNSELEFLVKKRRVGGPGSTTSKYGAVPSEGLLQTPPRPGQTTISNITLRKWTPTGSSPAREQGTTGGKSDAKPKYCPGDREQLLRRLATFQELTDWTPKPDRVNEVEWAKRGWACQGKERVKCTLCARELVVKLNRKEVDGKEIPVLIAFKIAESVVQRYSELIVESHAEDCPWRKKGCDDSLLRLPLPNPRVAIQDLRQRYDELCGRNSFLPYEFNLRLPSGLNIDTAISYLPTTFFTDPPASQQAGKTLSPSTASKIPNRPALALAILGWQGLTNPRIGPVPNSASCHTCLRRLGLWMFKSKEVDLETDTIITPAPMDHLDPLREHRFFCPWKNSAAQRNAAARPLAPGEEDKAGWEVLVEVLRNDAFIRQRVNLAHSRSKSSVPPRTTPAGLRTPERPITSGGHSLGLDDDEESEEVTKKKDQAMMSRLRRVKSLFNTKAGSKLKRLGSRPGTAHSNAAGGD